MLKQPEFERREESEVLLRVMEEHSSLLEEVLANALSTNVGGVQVVIGGEGRWRELRDCSLVLARYGVADQAIGTLGVLGPDADALWPRDQRRALRVRLDERSRF